MTQRRRPDDVATLAAAKALEVEAVARRALPALDEAGIETIVLKGPAFTEWLYGGEERRRPFSDVDVLVSPAEFEPAGRELVRIGFQRRQAGWAQLAVAFVRPGDSASLDLHRSLVGAEAEPAEVWTQLRDATVGRRFWGMEVRCLDRPGLAMHVATHAAQHGFEGWERPLEDLRRAIGAADRATWTAARELARSLDAEGAFAAGLGRLPEGSRLAEELELTAVVPRHVALRASPQRSELMLGFERLQQIEGRRARLRFLLGRLLPPAPQMRATDPLARRGRLGLAAAHARRLARVALALPGALRRRRPESQPPH